MWPLLAISRSKQCYTVCMYSVVFVLSGLDYARVAFTGITYLSRIALKKNVKTAWAVSEKGLVFYHLIRGDNRAL